MTGPDRYIVPADPTRSPDGRAQDAAWKDYVEELRGSALEFEAQWDRFREIYRDRRPEDGPPLVWNPTEEAREGANLTVLMRELGFESYAGLHRWSVDRRAEFWSHVIRALDLRFATPPRSVVEGDDPETVEWLPGAQLNIVDSCINGAPDAPAIVWASETFTAPRSMTYRELAEAVSDTAGGLLRAGFQPGDGIAMYMPLSTECVVAYLAIIMAGCHVISIADSFSGPELRSRLELGKARGVITVDHYVRAGKRIDLYEKVRDADSPRAVVIPYTDDEPELRSGDVLWREIRESPALEAPHIGNADRLLNILFSSGTTGEPKAIPWSHVTPLKCALDGRMHQDIRPGDRVAWPTNIGWMMGPWLIFATLLNRGTLALFEGNPGGAEFTAFVRNAGVDVLGLVPALVRAWRAAGLIAPEEWSGVRVFSSTGEASNAEDFLWLMSRTGYRAPVVEYLGGTEIGGGHLTGTVLQPASPAHFTTPALGTSFVILDDSHTPVAPGEEGELYLIPPAPGMSQRLLNRDHHDEYYEGCPTGPAGEKLRKHGDRVRLLHNGFLRAAGRSDDTMNLGGIKVSSVELERVLDRHPRVYQSAAVGVPAKDGGAERLIVFLKLNSETIESGELKRELNVLLARELNPLFRIHELVQLDTLPRTASNKVMRRELRARYRNDFES